MSAKEVVLADPVTLALDADGITSLAPNLGKMSGVKPDVRNYMILWSKAQPGSSQVEWTVAAPADGMYGVTIGVNGVGMRLTVSSNGKKVGGAVKEAEWHHLELGEIPLKAGENKVLLEIEAPTGKGNKGGNRFLLGPMELAQPAVRDAMLKEAVAARVQPDWFKDAGYGLMFQWTNRATPPRGDIKKWEQKVDDFDMDGFVKLVEDSGAAYVVWSITWGNQYISAPIKSLDAIIAGRTTQRDLLGEMTERLHEKGVKVIFYYHYGYDCMHSVDKEWMEAAGGYEADKTKLYTNLGKILSEIGTRYGEKLAGWWFDGGERYLNCHFDGSSGAEGILSVPFKEYTAMVKTGNPQRMVAYNSWIRPRITEYQDYYGGEGQKSFDPEKLTDGVFNSGRQKGLQAHGCFILEKSWGHIEKNKTIPKPKFSLAKLTGFVKKAQENRYPLSINLEMYEDGSVSPESYALLKALKAAVRK
ncbi:alpha-L-fucosidase [Haloferula rosea]|uniref:Alpha-L-fucosidase n=1 Tax=Haloferula rosea TaxID=490093 RepID=A0A934REG5_9BACT|nr:alpha-L-fucosidase [Haloferula rosea]MBK1829015.1 alpha-L-fucosidase [Haloferula rosea]